jgi:hypothetical protein
MMTRVIRRSYANSFSILKALIFGITRILMHH